MKEYKTQFDDYFSVKGDPSPLESELYKKSQRYIAWLRFIPGVQLVAIGNSLSMNATTEDSDIDLFIVTKGGVLWTVRLFITVLFHFLWVRRYWDKVKERFCLSFFVTENALDFRSIALSDDVYLYYWIYYLKPILNRDSTYEQFISLNSWVIIDEFQKQKNHAYVTNVQSGFLSFIGIVFFRFLELIIRPLFLIRTKRSARALDNPFGIIISSDMLKFHVHDIRKELQEKLVVKNRK